jgi:hypothetical protein
MRDIWIGVVLGAAALGCGTQASEDFPGAVLLQLQGRVTVDPVAAASDSIPALCFTQFTAATDKPADRLPESVLMGFEYDLRSNRTQVAHIVDVESRGHFPAEFDVNVYTPPPPEALERLTPEEPLAGFGMVCAVSAMHKPLAQSLNGGSRFMCDISDGSGAQPCNTPGTPVTGRLLSTTQDGSRYYLKTWDCEDGSDLDTCDITADGDVTLLREMGGYEGVFSLADAVQVIYLSEPAAAGSYTAYRAFAPDGLAAGYHVRPAHAELKPGVTFDECFGVDYLTPAIEQTNELHGTHYNSLPDYRDSSGVITRAPAEIVADFQRIAARLEMEACPLDKMIIEEPVGSLSIDLQAKWLKSSAYPPWQSPFAD